MRNLLEKDQTGEAFSSDDSNINMENEVIQVAMETTIDSIDMDLFNRLQEIVATGDNFLHICKKMKLERKKVKEIEETCNKEKNLLDFVGQKTLYEFLKLFQSDFHNIVQQLRIHFCSQPERVKTPEDNQSLGSLDNEVYCRIADELNANDKWEIIANKLRYNRRDVREIEKKRNPAKFFLDKLDFQNVTRAELERVMIESDLWYIWADAHRSHQMVKYRENAGSLRCLKQDMKQLSNWTCKNDFSEYTNIRESNVNNEVVESYRCSVTRCVSFMKKERRMQSRHGLLEKQESTRRYCKVVNSMHSEKHPEQNCVKLLNDATVQYAIIGNVQQQTSSVVPSDNFFHGQVPFDQENLSETSDEDDFQDSVEFQNGNDYTTPTDNSARFEKTPEENCANLLDDATAQQDGIGFRDIQNSIPDNEEHVVPVSVVDSALTQNSKSNMN